MPSPHDAHAEWFVYVIHFYILYIPVTENYLLDTNTQIPLDDIQSATIYEEVYSKNEKRNNKSEKKRGKKGTKLAKPYESLNMPTSDKVDVDDEHPYDTISPDAAQHDAVQVDIAGQRIYDVVPEEGESWVHN